MILVRETSRGSVLIEFSPSGGWVADNATVHRLDPDGWTEEGETWSSAEEGTLSDALVREMQLPAEEAEDLATTALAEWHDRGAGHMPRAERMKMNAALVIMFSLIPLALLALLIWLLTRAF